MGVVGVVVFVGLLIMRGYLVPKRVHEERINDIQAERDKAEKRADRWEGVALRALDATERLTEPLGVAAKVLTTLPHARTEEET
jgi:hypothetical protein